MQAVLLGSQRTNLVEEIKMPTELPIRRRVFTLLVLLVFLFLILTIRIVTLTTVESVALTQRGIRQWTRDGIVYARRGDILDTHGQMLVMSATAYIVSVNPRKVTDEKLFARTVGPVLKLSEESILGKLSSKAKASVTLKRQVSRDDVDILRKLEQSQEVEANAGALLYDEDVRRIYPRGAFLVQTLGLTNIDSVGQSGLEQQYESLLRGTTGRSLTSVDARSQAIYDSENLYVEPTRGSNIKLTIDANIQEICEKAMRECFAVNKANAVHAIAMDPYTGAILAMCSKPDYDPNNPPRNNGEELQSLMRIKIISDAYEPGSTFKVLTAAAALDSGVTTPSDSFYCNAKIKVDGDTIRCWGSPHKAETMTQALQNSCNPVFVELALRMGQERMYHYLKAFGLGNRTQVDLQGEGSGILIPVQSVKNVDLARIGFGQSVAVTPLQLITAACAVVNGGHLMRPYLLKEALAADGSILYRTLPKVVSTPISQETSQTMRELLELVVSKGGAKNAAISGYRIGGKTGTAQVYKEGRIVRDVHIGSFFGFAPANDPRIALLVIVDEADMPVDYGGTTAAPFARQILEDVLPYLGCMPQNGEPQTEVVVPNMIGKPLWEARKELHELGFAVLDDGQGEQVAEQMPASGASLVLGGQVMLYTNPQEPLTMVDLVFVPDVRGLSMVEAARLLRQRELEMAIEGSGIAVSQAPAPGEYVPREHVVTVNFQMPNKW